MPENCYPIRLCLPLEPSIYFSSCVFVIMASSAKPLHILRIIGSTINFLLNVMAFNIIP